MDEVQFPWWASCSSAMAMASALRVVLKDTSYTTMPPPPASAFMETPRGGGKPKNSFHAESPRQKQRNGGYTTDPSPFSRSATGAPPPSPPSPSPHASLTAVENDGSWTGMEQQPHPFASGRRGSMGKSGGGGRGARRPPTVHHHRPFLPTFAASSVSPLVHSASVVDVHDEALLRSPAVKVLCRIALKRNLHLGIPTSAVNGGGYTTAHLSPRGMPLSYPPAPLFHASASSSSSSPPPPPFAAAAPTTTTATAPPSPSGLPSVPAGDKPPPLPASTPLGRRAASPLGSRTANRAGASSSSSSSSFAFPPLYLSLQQCTAILALMAIALECRALVLKSLTVERLAHQKDEEEAEVEEEERHKKEAEAGNIFRTSGSGGPFSPPSPPLPSGGHSWKHSDRWSPSFSGTYLHPSSSSSPPPPPAAAAHHSASSFSSSSSASTLHVSPFLMPTSFRSFLSFCSTLFSTLLPQLPSAHFAEEVRAEEFCASLVACGILMRLPSEKSGIAGLFEEDEDEEDDVEDEEEEDEDEEDKDAGVDRMRETATTPHQKDKKENLPLPLSSSSPFPLTSSGGHGGASPTALPFSFSASSPPPHSSAMAYRHVLSATFGHRIIDAAILSCLPSTMEEVVQSGVAKGVLRGLSLAPRCVYWGPSLATRIRDLTSDGIQKSGPDREGGLFFSPFSVSASSFGGPSSASSFSSSCCSSSSSAMAAHKKREVLLLLLEAMSKTGNRKVLQYATPWMIKILEEAPYIIHGLLEKSLVHSRVVAAALTLLLRYYQSHTARVLSSSPHATRKRRSASTSLGCEFDVGRANRLVDGVWRALQYAAHYLPPIRMSGSSGTSSGSSTHDSSSPLPLPPPPPPAAPRLYGSHLQLLLFHLLTVEVGRLRCAIALRHTASCPTSLQEEEEEEEDSTDEEEDASMAHSNHPKKKKKTKQKEKKSGSRGGSGGGGGGGGAMRDSPPSQSGREASPPLLLPSSSSFSSSGEPFGLPLRATPEEECLRIGVLSHVLRFIILPTSIFMAVPKDMGEKKNGVQGGEKTKMPASSLLRSTAVGGAGGGGAGDAGLPREEEENVMWENIVDMLSHSITIFTSPVYPVRGGGGRGSAWERRPLPRRSFTAPLRSLPTKRQSATTTAAAVSLRGRSHSPPSSAAQGTHHRPYDGVSTPPPPRLSSGMHRRRPREFTRSFRRNMEGVTQLLVDQMIRDGGGIPDGTDVGFAFLVMEGREGREDAEEEVEKTTKTTKASSREEAGNDAAHRPMAAAAAAPPPLSSIAAAVPFIARSAAVQCLKGLAKSDPQIRAFIVTMLFDFVVKACTQCELCVLHPEESITVKGSQLAFDTLCAILVPYGPGGGGAGLSLTPCNTLEEIERYAQLVVRSYTCVLGAELQKPGAHLATMIQQQYLPTSGMLAVAQLLFLMLTRVMQRMRDLLRFGQSSQCSTKRWNAVCKETLAMAKILLTHVQACVLAVGWPDSGVVYHPSVAFEACFTTPLPCPTPMGTIGADVGSGGGEGGGKKKKKTKGGGNAAASSSSIPLPGKLLAAAAVRSIAPLLLPMAILLHLVPPIRSSLENPSGRGADEVSEREKAEKEPAISVEELSFRLEKCERFILKEGSEVEQFIFYLFHQRDFHTITNCCTPLFRSTWLLFTMYGMAEDAVGLMRPHFLTHNLASTLQTGLSLSHVEKVVACATSAPPLILMNSTALQQVVADIEILLRQLAKNELDRNHYHQYHVTLSPFSSSFTASTFQGKLAELKVRNQLMQGMLRVCPKSRKFLSLIRTRELFLLKAVLQLELTRVGAGYFSTIPLYQHFNVREFVGSSAIPKVLQYITEYLAVQLTAAVNYCSDPEFALNRLAVGTRRLLLYATFGVRSVRASSISFLRHLLHASPMQMIHGGGLLILWQLLDLVEEADPRGIENFCKRMQYVGDPSLPTEHYSAERMEELLALQELAEEWVAVGRRRAPHDLIQLATQFITSGGADGVSVVRVHRGTRLAILAGQIQSEDHASDVTQKKGKVGGVERGTSNMVMKFSRAYGSVSGVLSFLTPLQLELQLIQRLAALLKEGRFLLSSVERGRRRVAARRFGGGGEEEEEGEGEEEEEETIHKRRKKGQALVVGGKPSRQPPHATPFAESHRPLMSSSTSVLLPNDDEDVKKSFFSRFENELHAASFVLHSQPIRFKTHRILVLYLSQAAIQLFSTKAVHISAECWSWLTVHEQSTLIIPILKGISEAVQWTIGAKLGLFDGDQTQHYDVVQTGEDPRLLSHRENRRDAGEEEEGGESSSSSIHPETPHQAIFKFIVDNYLHRDCAMNQSPEVLSLLYLLASSILQNPDTLSLKDESFLETMQAMVMIGKIIHEVFSANIRRLRGDQSLIIPFTSLGRLRQQWWMAILHWFRKYPCSWYFGSDPSITTTAVGTLESLLLLLQTEKQSLRQSTIGFLNFSTNVTTPGKTIGMIPSEHRRVLFPKGSVASPEAVNVLVEMDEKRMTQCLELLCLLVDHELLRLRVWERPRRTLELTDTMMLYKKSVLLSLDAAVAHDPMVAVAMVRRLGSVFKKLPARLAQHVIARPERFAHIPQAVDYYLTSHIAALGAPKLYLFENASIIQALRLLDERYSHCESITSYAIRSLRSKNSTHLIFYLPQLLQVLGSDSSGRIQKFLLQMSTKSTMFCHQLLWALRTEGEGDDGAGIAVEEKSSSQRMASRCRSLTAAILHRLPPEQLEFYQNEFGFLDSVIALSGELMQFDKPQRKPQLRLLLKNEKFHTPPKHSHLYLPTNPDFRITDVIATTASAMQSAAKCPIFVQFEGVERAFEDLRKPEGMHHPSATTTTPPPPSLSMAPQKKQEKGRQGGGGGAAASSPLPSVANVVPIKKACIFKMGDDCRQDQLALQLIELFKRVFHSIGVPSFLYPYRVVTTGQTSGIIECVPQSLSRNEIGKLVESNLAEYFVQCFGHPETSRFRRARENFVKSVAAYSIVTFVLNIKDRHNGNIMVDASGNLIHIDFGFLFDTSPGGDLNFENSPFKLTTEMIQLIGRDVGHRSTLRSSALQKALIDEDNYIYFKTLANRCFLAVRQYAPEICVLVELMLRSGLPCFKPQYTIASLAERLCMDQSEMKAAHFMRTRIHTAKQNIRTNLYDHFQRAFEGIEM